LNRVIINEALCKGCRLCIDACPKDILVLDTGKVNAKGYNPISCTDMPACTACAICARICPDSVISVERGTALKSASTDSKATDSHADEGGISK